MVSTFLAVGYFARPFDPLAINRQTEIGKTDRIVSDKQFQVPHWLHIQSFEQGYLAVGVPNEILGSCLLVNKESKI